MKLTTKVLLGATLVAGLTTSAFAACATDVDMGAKKLTNVADGVADGDAVNYAQALKQTVHTIVLDTDKNLTAHDVPQITKIGNICVFHARIQFSSALSSPDTINSTSLIPAAYQRTSTGSGWTIMQPQVGTSSDTALFDLTSNGSLVVNSNKVGLYPMNVAYPCSTAL